jgi:hypothetical protein
MTTATTTHTLYKNDRLGSVTTLVVDQFGDLISREIAPIAGPVRETSYKLPMRIAQGFPLRPRTFRDVDGGWSVMECESREHALAIMREYPNARMPCWGRIERGEV